MELSWATAIQALILAACTWYMRRGSVRDKEDVKRNTSTPADVERVRAQLEELRTDFNILKAAYFRANSGLVNHQSPKRDPKP